MALLAGKLAERPVEGDQMGVRGHGEGQQPAIAHPFRGGLMGEWLGRLPEYGIDARRIWKKQNARVFKPKVENLPCFPQGTSLLPHHGGICQQAKESNLRVAGEEKTRIDRESMEPLPCFFMVRVASDGERQPDVQIKK